MICPAIFAAFFFAPLIVDSQTDLTKFPKPSERQIAGFDKVFCVELDKTNRICKGLAADQNEARFFVEREGKSAGAWRTQAFLGDVSEFEIWRGDLDGDKANEIVILNYDGQSNGMGVNYRTVYILPPTRQNSDGLPIQPLQFSAEDFTIKGGFVKNSQTGKFEILVSDWEWNWQAQGKKSGLYLVGRWFTYKNGALNVSAKPIVVRRYTKKFEKSRNSNSEGENFPFVWIKSADAETRKSDLMNAAETETVFDGTIETVKIARIDSPVNESGTSENAAVLNLQIKTNDGNTRTFEYSDSQNSGFSFFGDWKSRRVFPKNYLPTAAAQKLNGQRVRLIRYKNESDGDFNVLWLF